MTAYWFLLSLLMPVGAPMPMADGSPQVQGEGFDLSKPLRLRPPEFIDEGSRQEVALFPRKLQPIPDFLAPFPLPKKEWSPGSIGIDIGDPEGWKVELNTRSSPGIYFPHLENEVAKALSLPTEWTWKKAGLAYQFYQKHLAYPKTANELVFDGLLGRSYGKGEGQEWAGGAITWVQSGGWRMIKIRFLLRGRERIGQVDRPMQIRVPSSLGDIDVKAEDGDLSLENCYLSRNWAEILWGDGESEEPIYLEGCTLSGVERVSGSFDYENVEMENIQVGMISRISYEREYILSATHYFLLARYSPNPEAEYLQLWIDLAGGVGYHSHFVIGEDAYLLSFNGYNDKASIPFKGFRQEGHVTLEFALDFYLSFLHAGAEIVIYSDDMESGLALLSAGITW